MASKGQPRSKLIALRLTEIEVGILGAVRKRLGANSDSEAVRLALRETHSRLTKKKESRAK